MFKVFNRIIKKIVRFLVFIIIISILVGLTISFVFPIGYKDYINIYSNQYDIDPFLVAAIINVESKYNKEAVSNRNARGLMQITSQTGKWGAQELAIKGYSDEMLFEPEINIRIGVWYLNQLNKEFNGELSLVLAAYNAGSGNVTKWLADGNYSKDGRVLSEIPFKETKEYLEKVTFNYKVYNVFYENFMEKPDSMNSIYTDVIITLREYLKDLLNSLRKGRYFEI